MPERLLTIRGKEYFLTDDLMPAYRDLESSWKKELKAIYASKSDHIPGALDGSDISVKANRLTMEYLDRVEALLGK